MAVFCRFNAKHFVYWIIWWFMTLKIRTADTVVYCVRELSILSLGAVCVCTWSIRLQLWLWLWLWLRRCFVKCVEELFHCCLLLLLFFIHFIILFSSLSRFCRGRRRHRSTAVVVIVVAIIQVCAWESVVPTSTSKWKVCCCWERERLGERERVSRFNAGARARCVHVLRLLCVNVLNKRPYTLSTHNIIIGPSLTAVCFSLYQSVGGSKHILCASAFFVIERDCVYLYCTWFFLIHEQQSKLWASSTALKLKLQNQLTSNRWINLFRTFFRLRCVISTSQQQQILKTKENTNQLKKKNVAHQKCSWYLIHSFPIKWARK